MAGRKIKFISALAGVLALAGMSGAFGNPVLSFTGNNSYVNIGTPAALQIPSNDPFTVEGWMLFNALSTRDMLYCKNNAHSGSPYTYMLGFADHKLAAFYTGSWQGNFPVSRELGRWYHVAFSFDGSTIFFYLDGQLLGTAGFSFVNTATHAAKIGGYDSSSDINGRMSDVRVWDYARTQAQIQDKMHHRLIGEEDGLLGYWPLSEGAGAIAADSTANASDGEIINASWVVDEDLQLLDFIVENPLTGSKRFTNTNKLDIIKLPSLSGYTDYQITTNGATPVDGAWISTNIPPAPLEFAMPGTDTELLFTAWLTNTSASVEVQRIDRNVIFTSVKPIPSIRATYSRQVLPGCGAIFYPEDLNNASTGGQVFSSAIPIHSLRLRWLSGPAPDATPDDPWVTLHTIGSYQMELIVMNAAGNLATSSVCLAQTQAWNGDPFTWTGAIDTDWHQRLNWNFDTVPCAGADVVIESGADITIEESSAVLGAFSISNATLTFANWDTVLAADSFRAEDGTLITHAGPINDNAMSNRVHIACSNFTLVAGAVIDVNDKGYAGTRNGTVGFFGNGPGKPTRERGAAGHGGKGGYNNSGETYGDPIQPLWPGSGGDGQYGATGGHGGGAVRIDVAGLAVVNGEILASSSNVGGNSGGGSGGSIYLSAATIAATNGVLRANGASTTQMGGGGGGRVAVVVTDHAAQATLPRVVYELSARRGDRATTGHGEHGTVYLNDRNLMPAVMNHCNGIFLGFGDGDWTLPALAVADSWIIADNDLSLTVNGDMRLTNSIIDFTHLSLAVNGNLDLAGTSLLYVCSRPTNGIAPWGATVDITDTLSLGAGSVIYPASDPTNGGSVCFTVGNLTMESGSEINADGLGYAGGPMTGYGPGAGTGYYGGAGYGGMGGRPPLGGPTYGSDTNPTEPGSGGAGRNGKSGSPGGGLICLHIAGTAVIDGTITADGLASGNEQACGSGGGIYIAADTLSAAFGAINADGGTNSSSYGAGGGGRIALLYRIDNFDGVITAAGGTGTYPGEDGTIVRELNPAYIELVVQGEPERHGVSSPYDYGVNGVFSGSIITNTVNSPADEADGQRFTCLGWTATNNTGEAFSGETTESALTVTSPTWLTWLWTNQYYLDCSAGANGSLAVDLTGWYTNGVSLSIQAVPDTTYEFLQWAGPGLPAEKFADNPLLVRMDRTREVTAVFISPSPPSERHAAQDGEWLDPATWTPPGVPAPADKVFIQDYTVSLNDPAQISALAISGTGRLDLEERSWLHIAGNTIITGALARLNLNQGNLTGGTLEILDGGEMLVHSGPCEFPEDYDHTHPPATNYGSLVRMGGNLLIGNGSILYSQSHSATNGGTALFQVGALTVTENGRFDADSLGYPGGPNSHVLGGYGPGAGLVDRGSGSYGGKGATGGGPIYGSYIAPVQAGSSGGGSYGATGGAGGGAIRVEAQRWITVDGVMTAVGGLGGNDAGGGSGGSIFLDCAGLRGAGTISAQGGGNTHATFGAGGGGRIAVYTTFLNFSTNSISAAGGENTANPDRSGEDGTIYWLFRPPKGTTILMK